MTKREKFHSSNSVSLKCNICNKTFFGTENKAGLAFRLHSKYFHDASKIVINDSPIVESKLSGKDLSKIHENIEKNYLK